MSKKEQVVALERVELSDSDDDFEYAEVEVSDDDDDLLTSGGDNEDLLSLSLKKKQSVGFKAGASGGGSVANTGAGYGGSSVASGTAAGGGARGRAPVAETVSHPVVVDDFVRNFLLNAGLHRSLDAFNTEWYELTARGLLKDAGATTPDIYVQNAALEDEIRKLRDELKVLTCIDRVIACTIVCLNPVACCWAGATRSCEEGSANMGHFQEGA
jgi:hypothetical protein